MSSNKLREAVQGTKEDLTKHTDKKNSDYIDQTRVSHLERVQEKEARACANKDDIKETRDHVDKMEKPLKCQKTVKNSLHTFTKSKETS